jgi:hypothetical protein
MRGFLFPALGVVFNADDVAAFLRGVDASAHRLLQYGFYMPSSEPTRYRALIGVAAAVVIIAGLKFAAEFCMPVLLGIMVAAVSSPVTTWLLRKGAPPLAAASAVLGLDIAVLGSLGSLFFLAASDLQERLPMYISRYQRMSTLADRFMRRHGLDGVDASLLHLNEFLSDAAGRFAGMATLMVVVLLVAFLALCELTIMGDKLRSLSPNANEQFERVDRIVREVQLYLGVKFWTSLTAGLLRSSSSSCSGSARRSSSRSRCSCSASFRTSEARRPPCSPSRSHSLSRVPERRSASAWDFS